MATTDDAQGCPCCRRAQYAFRVASRLDDDVPPLSRYAFCGRDRGYVYYHPVRARPPAAMGGVGDD